MQTIIPSKRRSDIIGNHALRWFPDAIVCVEDSEQADYSCLGNKLLLHPPLAGLPAIINWILACSDIPDSEIVIVDDDLIRVDSIVREKPTKIDTVSDVASIVQNCYTMAQGFGARVWGFSVNRRPDSNYAYKPFSLAARIGSFRGFSDRSIRLDESFRRHDDVDLALNELLTNRVVFRDDRFNFVFKPVYKTPGGSKTDYDNEDRENEETALKQKWGKHVYFVRSPHHRNETRINVRR